MDNITLAVIGSLFGRMTIEERIEWMHRFTTGDVKAQILEIGDEAIYNQIAKLLMKEIELSVKMPYSEGGENQ